MIANGGCAVGSDEHPPWFNEYSKSLISISRFKSFCGIKSNVCKVDEFVSDVSFPIPLLTISILAAVIDVYSVISCGS